MGISVEGQKCPVCGAYLFDNDDLVFCPECGAPHHRDCYEVLGHCAYKDKHGTPEGYKPPQAEEEKTTATDEPHFANTDKKCRFCGEPLAENENVCHRCSRPQQAAQPPFGAPFGFDPLGGVAPDELIGDVSAKDVKSFVVVNTQRYIPRFYAMNNKKKKSWNWAAFFVPHVWFFYRKMYLPGILFCLLTITTSLFLLPLSRVVSTFPQEVTNTTAQLARYLMDNMSTIGAMPLSLAFFGLIAEIIVRVVAGFAGDRLYRKSVIEGIKKAKNEETELEIPTELALAKKGGVNALLGLISLFSFDMILTWIGTIYLAL